MNVDNQRVQRPHLSGYQNRDREVIDYHMDELGATGLMFRGPIDSAAFETTHSTGYLAYVGAAQTFGCFVHEPFPDLVARSLDMAALNLGYGGAGPEFFAQQPQLLPYLNGAKAVVLQVMSGRSQSNSLYHCGGLELVTRLSDGRVMGAQRAFSEAMLPGPQSILGKRVPTRIRKLLPNNAAANQARVEGIVEEVRQAWVESYLALIDAITVPIVLFWFSKRTPDYQERYQDVATVFGQFPQLVNAEMVSAVATRCDHYVECVTDRGSPQPLFSRFTGQPTVVDPSDDRADLGTGTWTHNRYYPSPEMHEDAAAALLPACREAVGR